MIENIIVFIYSWEYPIYFLVLQPKDRFNGYPLILARPLIETTDAYTGCRVENMALTNGHSQKQLDLYPPTHPLMKEYFPM
jgi:hypothetical protein